MGNPLCMDGVVKIECHIFCYRLGQRSASRPGAPRSAAKEEQERARNLKTNRMLISMVVVFGICWLPLNCINFLADLDFFPIYCWEYYHFMFFVCHVLAMSSTCYNPFLYGNHNEAFQREFIKMVPALRVICSAGQSSKSAADAAEQNGRNQLTPGETRRVPEEQIPLNGLIQTAQTAQPVVNKTATVATILRATSEANGGSQGQHEVTILISAAAAEQNGGAVSKINNEAKVTLV
jgi:neuropeptide Y receptor